MNGTISKQSIDVCNSAEWQSRGPTEILLKAFAIYFTTAVLLLQYGARCKIPLKERWWFVIRALLFPLWSATALLLNILTSVVSSIAKFGEKGGPLQALCAAIAMSAKAQKGDVLPATEFRTEPNLPLPTRVPLCETSHIVYPNSLDDSMPLRVEREKPKKSWKKRSLSILVTLVYILQASTTLLLMFRRSEFTKKEYTAHGEHMALDDRVYNWWKVGPGYNDDFQGGFTKSVAFTPADSSATKLAIYGILVALCYILVESTELRWRFAKIVRPWVYQMEGSEGKASRCCVGICFSYLTDYALYRFIGTLSTYRRVWAMFSEVLRLGYVSDRATGNVPFLVGAILILIILQNLKPMGLRIPIWLRSNLRTYFSPLYLPQALFKSFDFKHQDPSRFQFLEGDFDATMSKTEERAHLFTDARHRQTRYYLYVIAWAIPLIVFGVISLYEDFWTSRPQWERWVKDDGCVVRGDLNAWAWKDPLADMLWAF